MTTLFLLFSAIYLFILFSFIVGILRLPCQRDKKQKPISIIVAARNEEANIANLIKSISAQNYPHELFELIIADDRSEDRTATLVQKYALKYDFIKFVKITEQNPALVGKKGAISAAINEAQHDILAFTDADCIVGKDWLKEINSHFTDEIDFVAGFSFIDMGNKFFTGLKNIERSAIFAVTSGSFGLDWAVTCTAGNMSYRKSIFQKIGGFSGIGHIPSGDDDLLLQKMRHEIREMNFIFKPKAMVNTSNISNIGSHIQRESRRASKWKYYTPSIKLLTLFVFLYYIIFITTFFLLFFQSFGLELFLSILGIKVIFETLLISIFLHKIRRKKLLLYLPIAELIYLPYFIYFALRGTFGKYKWK